MVRRVDGWMAENSNQIFPTEAAAARAEIENRMRVELTKFFDRMHRLSYCSPDALADQILFGSRAEFLKILSPERLAKLEESK